MKKKLYFYWYLCVGVKFMWNMVKLCYGYKKDIVDDIVNIF